MRRRRVSVPVWLAATVPTGRRRGLQEGARGERQGIERGEQGGIDRQGQGGGCGRQGGGADDTEGDGRSRVGGDGGAGKVVGAEAADEPECQDRSAKGDGGRPGADESTGSGGHGEIRQEGEKRGTGFGIEATPVTAEDSVDGDHEQADEGSFHQSTAGLTSRVGCEEAYSGAG
ncbi:hypothetical protein DFJ73DRAFT_759752 [Zopfochytrium polystomum]|nr:hypothetical protein DFJ73DRAFT_759752 [Zopfochytrium polystomum]